MIESKMKEVTEKEYQVYMKESIQKAQEEQEHKESLLARQKQQEKLQMLA